MPPLRRIGGERLKHQRRFADTGIAADEKRRAGHQPAAGDAVELGDAGHAAAGFFGGGGEAFERERAALADLRADAPMGGAAASSTSVFHAPQSAHCPAHLEWAVPHDWQTKARAAAGHLIGLAGWRRNLCGEIPASTAADTVRDSGRCRAMRVASDGFEFVLWRAAG